MKDLILRHKNLFLNSVLLVLSVIFVLFIPEIALRFTSYKYLVGGGHIRYYYKVDNVAAYDISEKSPPKKYSFRDYAHLVWSNELGCFDVPYKNEKKYILLAGDSFTWGFTPYDHKYGTLIERYLAYRILKCGVAGYGTRQVLLKIQKILDRTKTPPKLIIVGYVLGNDFLDDWIFPQATIIDGYLVDKVKNADYVTWRKEVIPDNVLREKIENWKKFGVTYKPHGIISKIKVWLKSHSILCNMIRNVRIVRTIINSLGLSDKPDLDPFDFVEQARHGKFVPMFYQIDKYPYLKKAWEEHLNHLKGIKNLSDKIDAKLLIVLIPPKEQIYEFLAPYGKSLGRLNEIIQRFLNEENINYLDLTPDFKKHANKKVRKYLDSNRDLYWRYDGHWNIKGNRLTALLISKYIIDRALVDISEREKKKREIEKELNKSWRN